MVYFFYFITEKDVIAYLTNSVHWFNSSFFFSLSSLKRGVHSLLKIVLRRTRNLYTGFIVYFFISLLKSGS